MAVHWERSTKEIKKADMPIHEWKETSRYLQLKEEELRKKFRSSAGVSRYKSESPRSIRAGGGHF
jgi:hypothetical protein